MCYCKEGADIEEFTKYLERAKTRGPDDTRVYRLKDGIIGFCRLAIMGLNETGMQPFNLGENYIVCNGEIYGYAKIKKRLEGKYEFKSGSDCEVLLPLYREYGTDMFNMLDAEFACVIYDGEEGEFIAARDPIGIRPLYFGYDGDGTIAFASEPKNLVGLVKKIMPFPPGHFYKKGKFIPYCKIYEPQYTLFDGEEEVLKNIREKLISGVEKRLVSDAKVGFLLSGGLDSSLVCGIAARNKKKIRTFAIGMEGDAIDLKYARRVAEYIKSEHTEVKMTREEVINSLEEVIKILGTYDITTVRASIGMYLVCKYIHMHTDIRVLLTGEISDELFGYKYTDFAPDEKAFQRESEKRIRELHAYDVLRADRCISVNSLEARVPFGDLDFVRYVMAVNPKLKMNRSGKGKYLLRKAFERDKLIPESILWREKAAFSDAVGHSMVDDIKEYAEGLYTEDEFRSKIKKYEYCPPFTKESLLYREIFEKYYSGQAEMIPGFWMPNSEWRGCKVSDPSARVLSNYGDSGK